MTAEDMYKQMKELSMTVLQRPRQTGKSVCFLDIETIRGLDLWGSDYPGAPNTGSITIKKESTVNPITSKTVKYEAVRTERAEIENTKWFDNATHYPGQPGVFEVDPIVVADGAEGQRRFSYHNGRDFGPVKLSPAAAADARFEKSKLAGDIKRFRGLVEQA